MARYPRKRASANGVRSSRSVSTPDYGRRGGGEDDPCRILHEDLVPGGGRRKTETIRCANSIAARDRTTDGRIFSPQGWGPNTTEDD